MSTSSLRHARSTEVSWRQRFATALGELRPLDPMRSIKMKLIIIIAATVVMFTVVTWAGIRFDFGVLRTFPVALVSSLLITQFLARGMTRPLREMTAAARAMARGEYSSRVHTHRTVSAGRWWPTCPTSCAPRWRRFALSWRTWPTAWCRPTVRPWKPR